MTIGEAVKTKRIERGMSQEELAKIVGYQSRSSINKIELDLRDPPHSMIIAIAKALDVSPNYLMGWEEPDTYANASPAELYLDNSENQLIELFRKLNDEGKETALNTVRGLTLIDQYKKCDTYSESA